MTVSGCEKGRRKKFVATYAFLIGVFVTVSQSLAASNPPKTTLTVWGEAMPHIDFKENNGYFGYQTYGLKYDHPLIELRLARTFLNWPAPAQLSLGDGKHVPVSNVNHVGVTAKYPVILKPNRVWLNKLGVSMAYESSVKEAVGINVTSFVHEQVQPNWSVAYGGFVHYHPVRTRFYPLLGVGYRTRARVGVFGFAGFPKTYLGYGFNPQWQISVGALYHQFMFKLDKHNPLAESGYAEIESWQGDATLHYHFAQAWSLKTSVRWSSDHRFIVYGSDKSRDQTYTLEPAWGGRIALEYTF